MLGYNLNLDEQIELLKEILKKNKVLMYALNYVQEMNIDSMYIASGAICQTVWNYQNNNELLYGITDFDVVYFDEDTSYEAEDVVIKKLQGKVNHLPIDFDIKNQARVHIWYNPKYHRQIPPYTSVYDSIGSWSSTASCTGVQLKNNELKIFAPYGLNDLFGQILRPNKILVTRDMYDVKVEKWTSKWNTLKVIKW